MVWLQVLILWFLVGIIAAVLLGIVCRRAQRDPDEADPAMDDRRPRNNGGHH
jgi:flagellar biosynthesis/type III secretory pathway M-ring protein FliF/YscJ